MNNRVVITGIGIWSCIGTNPDTVKESLYKGKSGIGIKKERLTYGYRSALSGIVESPIITKDMLNRHIRVGLSEEAQYAYMACCQALKTAEIDEDYLKKNEIGCIFGNDSSAQAVIESFKTMEKERDTQMLGYGAVLQSMNSTVTMNLSQIFHLRGINFTVSAACASSSHSIGLAYLLIKQGLQNAVLCGGAQETNLYSMASFDAIRTFSIKMDSPEKASRPFDKDRDGLVPSGGAAALMIESKENAEKRGAKILAEITGYGFSGNGSDISKPSSEGSVTAILRALKDAGISPDKIDYVNAHATSTPQGDICEAIALNEIFSNKKPLVSSTKSMTGHECWMAGASEAIYSVIMLNNNFVAPNINLENPDEYSSKLNIATQTVETQVDTVLSNSFGFGGTNSALIIEKFKK